MRIDRKRVITAILTTAMVIGLATSVKAEIIPGCEACKIRYGYAVPMKKTGYYTTKSHCLYGHNTIYVYECNNHPKDHAKVESCSTCGFKIK